MGPWALMAHQFSVLGYEIETRPLLRGAALSAAVALILAVGVASFTDTDTASVIISSLMVVGFIIGGLVAGRSATKNPMAHGALSAIPISLLVIAVTLIRRNTDIGPEIVLFLIALVVLTTSCGTFGGLIGGRISPQRKSLLH